VVISDVRFPNEVQSIKRQGGMVIWVQRGPLPVWYDTAIAALDGSVSALRDLTEQGVHSSETSWLGTDFDAVIDNNGSITGLYDQIKNLLQAQQASTVT
jgi:hypothetical protein